MYWKLLHVRTSVWRAPPKHALDWLVAGCWHWGQSWAAVTSNTSPLPTSISRAITQYLHPLHLHPFSQHHAYISLLCSFSAVDSGQWTTNTEVCSSEECKQWTRRVAIVPGTPPSLGPGPASLGQYIPGCCVRLLITILLSASSQLFTSNPRAVQI